MTPFRVPWLGPLLVCIASAGCGMKGPPLPPLNRVPAAPAETAAFRYDADVYVRFVVPRANVEGEGPASIARVEVYAVTLEAPPDAGTLQTAALRRAATLVATEAVRMPPPPPDPEHPDQPPPLVEPGLDQGATVFVRETLDASRLVPVASGATVPVPGVEAPALPAAAPTWVPGGTTLPERYYFIVGVRRDGRYGRASAPVAVPLDPIAGAPSVPVLTYDAREMTITWSPPSGARQVPEAGDDLLPAEPLFAEAPPTRYDVFRVPAPGTADTAAADEVRVPDAVNDAPVAATRLVVPGVVFGEVRCYAVRAVDQVSGHPVRGPLSEAACVTARDTFPPAAPTGLAAVSGAGSISLIWEPGTEADLAGYIVLRAEAAGGELQPVTAAPIRETTFRDTSVQPGVRYVYAIMAVDSASPPNRSPASARVEETARQ